MGLFSFVASRTSSPQVLTSRVKMLFTFCPNAIAPSRAFFQALLASGSAAWSASLIFSPRRP
jgi:hypothetical protein